MYISVKLIDKLKQHSENPVSQYILDLYHNDPRIMINGIGYLDIAIENKNKISYIIEKSFFKFLDYYTIHKDDYGMTVKTSLFAKGTFKGDYVIATLKEYNDVKVVLVARKNGIKIRTEVYKSGLNSETLLEIYTLPHLAYNGHLREKHAIMLAPGKFASKFTSVSQQNVDRFSRLFVSGHGIELMEVVGGDITRYYHRSKYYDKERGSLGNSCMKHDGCRKYFQLYAENNVRMLVSIVPRGLINGRALIWPDIYFSHLQKTVTFMDRVYTNNSSHEELFKNYAKDKGWVYKLEQNYNNKQSFVYEGRTFDDNVDYVLQNIDFEYWPYLDTLSWIKKDTLSNYNTGLRLDSTEGYIGGEYSEFHECYIAEGEAVYSNHHGSYLFASETFRIQGDYYHTSCVENGTLSECYSCGNSYYHVTEDMNTSILSGKMYCNNHSHYSENMQGYLGDDECFYYKGDYYNHEQAIYSGWHACEIPTEFLTHVPEIKDYVLTSELETILEELEERKLMSEEEKEEADREKEECKNQYKTLPF